MSIADVLTRIENDVTAEVQHVVDSGKRLLEEHLPAIKAGAADVEALLNEPFIAAYAGSAVKVPEHLVNIGLDFLAKLTQAWQGQPAAPAAAEEAGPVGLDAQPDVAA